MGARAQVKIEETGVYLYTHWGADTLAEDVQEGLKRAQSDGRLDDDEYLARIIFDAMKGDDTTGTISYGIGTVEHGDLDYEPLIIDCATKTITYKGEVYGMLEFMEKSFNGK